jgi:hypothetical protein
MLVEGVAVHLQLVQMELHLAVMVEMEPLRQFLVRPLHTQEGVVVELSV